VSPTVQSCTRLALLIVTVVIAGEAKEPRNPLVEFLRLPPAERVLEWKRDLTPGVGIFDREWSQQTAGLIAYGTDAIAELTAIVRQDKPLYQIEAVKVLCEMDRYVPVADTVLTGADGTIRSDVFGIEGYADPFRKVDGRRIGKQAYEAVMWAAEQRENIDLRTIARHYTGILREEIDALPLLQKVEMWKKEAIKTKAGFDSGRPEHYYLFHELSASLIEKEGSSAIAPMTEILNTDKNGFVRSAAVHLLQNIDLCAVRLRRMPEGKQAVEALKTAFERGNLKPVYRRKDLREGGWQALSNQISMDEWLPDRNSFLFVIAMAFERLYRERVIVRGAFGNIPHEGASAELKNFVTYLTEADPSFPSWEYSYCGFFPRIQVLHPAFKTKMARYYEEWKKFEATSHVSENHAKASAPR
jgi:hypothetical protein